jgi:hypothetical protein
VRTPDPRLFAVNRRFWDEFFFSKEVGPRQVWAAATAEWTRLARTPRPEAPDDPATRERILEHLLGDMARAAGSVGARLIVLNIPYFERGWHHAMPAPLKDSLARWRGRTSACWTWRRPSSGITPIPPAPLLRFDRDRHPNPAAHALIADAVDGFVRDRGLLPGLPRRDNPAMQYRALGRTGLKVSEIGYGAWGLGRREWIGADDKESLRSLNRAIDLGVNFLDTALAYGEGHSEGLIGRVLKERREEVYVATKVPPKNRRWPAPKTCPCRRPTPATTSWSAARRA